MTFPLITAAITSYNASDTILRAIRSAIHQDWPNLEILIVDDASTDKSSKLIGDIAKQDERVRFIEHEYNLGVGAARNTLWENAKGQFIVFFDDDDESNLQRIRKQYERTIEYEKSMGSSLVICYSAREQIYPNGETRYEPTVGMDLTPAPSGEQMADLILIGRPLKKDGGTCAACSMFVRKQVLESIGGFNSNLHRGEDTDFNLRFALKGGHFAGLSAPLVMQHMTISKDKKLGKERQNAEFWIRTQQKHLEAKSWYQFSVNWVALKFDFLERYEKKFLTKLLLIILQHPYKTMTKLYWSFSQWQHYRRMRSFHQEL